MNRKYSIVVNFHVESEHPQPNLVWIYESHMLSTSYETLKEALDKLREIESVLLHQVGISERKPC